MVTLPQPSQTLSKTCLTTNDKAKKVASYNTQLFPTMWEENMHCI